MKNFLFVIVYFLFAFNTNAGVVEDCMLVDEHGTHVTEAKVSCADGVAEVSVVPPNGGSWTVTQQLYEEWRPYRIS